MQDCCYNNIEKAKRIGRANYHCSECDGDVSVLWFMFEMAKDEHDKAKDHSHSHCFDQEKPACGMPSHTRCCLCSKTKIQVVNPGSRVNSRSPLYKPTEPKQNCCDCKQCTAEGCKSYFKCCKCHRIDNRIDNQIDNQAIEEVVEILKK